MLLSPEDIDNARDEAATYRDRGLPTVEMDGRPYVQTGEFLAALHVPAALGRRVREDLRTRAIPAPVLARMTGGIARWTFLSWADRWPQGEAADDLLHAGAAVTGRQAGLVPLPAGWERIPGQPWWIQPPGAGLPDLSVLVLLTRMAARGLVSW